MSTENGLARMSAYRGALHTLSRRRAYLEERLVVMRETGATEEAQNWVAAEILALNLAVPALEAEWDSMARIRRMVMALGEDRDSTPVDSVTPSGVSCPEPSPQGDRHG